MWISLLASVVLVLAPGCQAGKQFWWMNDPSVFSSGNKQPQQQQQQQHQQHVSNTNQDYQAQNNYNTPSQNLDVASSQGWFICMLIAVC